MAAERRDAARRVGIPRTPDPEQPRQADPAVDEVGDRDLLNPNVMRDDMHDWVLANERMAAALQAKGYHYQFLFVRNAGHTDRAVKQQTLPAALEWLWRGYSPRREIRD
jgi:iron(III)-enterobactin esterase